MPEIGGSLVRCRGTRCGTRQRDVEAAQTALRLAERARSRFQAPKARYTRECARLEGDGKRRLSAMSADLETYLERASAGGSGVVGHNGSANVGGALQGLPDGWAIVPLSAIDDSDSGVTGAESFGKGYSSGDLAWAFGALHEVVLPAMARGKGADYFQQRDQAEGRMGVRSYSDTYRGFFGQIPRSSSIPAATARIRWATATTASGWPNYGALLRTWVGQVSSVREGRTTLADALARRHRAEAAMEQVWHDVARESFRRQVLEPIDLETSRADAAMRDLDQELARALVALA